MTPMRVSLQPVHSARQAAPLQSLPQSCPASSLPTVTSGLFSVSVSLFMFQHM